MAKLTDRAVKAAGPGKYSDGDGLILVVSDAGAKKWVHRFQMAGKRRDMGLGRYPEVSLSEARTAATAARALAGAGIDPIGHRDNARQKSAKIPTFREVAADVIAEAQARTTNKKVAYQWARHLGPAYSGPLLDRPINEITTVDVAKVLKSVWREKPEVARKLHPAIKKVFEAGRIILRDQHGINFANPALWDDLKAMGFEAPQQLSRGHYPSLHYAEIQEFVSALRNREAAAALMLEFTIITNIRTEAVIAADWKEFDLEKKIWSVPVISLKDKKHRTEAFRLPLSVRAVEILETFRQIQTKGLVFPGRGEKRVSNMAMLTLIKRMNSGDRKWLDPDGRKITVHGFRATFKTWCEESGHFPNNIIEAAMGHKAGGKVERAYNRTDLLEHRRRLMEAWANYCQPKAANVIAFTQCDGDPS